VRGPEGAERRPREEQPIARNRASAPLPKPETSGRQQQIPEGASRCLPRGQPRQTTASLRWARTSDSLALRFRLPLARMTGAYWLSTRGWTGPGSYGVCVTLRRYASAEGKT
jgi:hypothetical protein